jgi:hypothetical protein
MPTVTVEARVVGRRAPLLADWSVDIPPQPEERGDVLRLRVLIERIVRAEVAAFAVRQAERRLLHILNRAEIAEAVTRGKVDFGQHEGAPHVVDPEAAVANALQAFEDGLYFVFVDGRQHMELDDEVHLRADSRVHFLRLVALSGG